MDVLGPLRNRNTVDTIMLLLAGVVAVVIVASAGVVLWVAATDAEHVDAGKLADQVGQLTGALITLLIGYVTGRGVSAPNGKKPDNGSTNTPEEG